MSGQSRACCNVCSEARRLWRDRFLPGRGTSVLPIRASDEQQKPTSCGILRLYQETGFRLPAALSGTERPFSLYPVERGGLGHSCDTCSGRASCEHTHSTTENASGGPKVKGRPGTGG